MEASSNVERLRAEIGRLQEDGVVDIKLFRKGLYNSHERLAGSVLTMLNAPVVEDKDIF